MSKKSDPLGAHWDCLADFRDQYILKTSGEAVIESRGHTLVTDRANYTMSFGRVTRDEHPAPVIIQVPQEDAPKPGRSRKAQSKK